MKLLTQKIKKCLDRGIIQNKSDLSDNGITFYEIKDFGH